MSTSVLRSTVYHIRLLFEGQLGKVSSPVRGGGKAYWPERLFCEGAVTACQTVLICGCIHTSFATPGRMLQVADIHLGFVFSQTLCIPAGGQRLSSAGDGTSAIYSSS